MNSMKNQMLLMILGVGTGLASAGAWMYGPDFSRPGAAGQTTPSYVSTATEAPSFSEVENAKAHLNALAEDFVQNVKALEVKAYYASMPGSLGERRTKTLRTLFQGYSEFKGTTAEPRVVRAILQLLGTVDEPAAWMQFYLHFLYSHPAHPLVKEYAGQAVVASVRCGAEAELQNAFAFTAMVPETLEGSNPAEVAAFPVRSKATGFTTTL